MPNYLDLADRTWPLLRRLMGGHTAVYRATRGVIGHRVPGIGSMLLLDHVGAKSGTKRTSPLLYGRDSGAYVIVASKGGNPKNPGWYHNLRANPETTIQVGSERIPVRARVADGEERDRLFEMMTRGYGGYADYQKRTDRKIPIVVLDPS
jgi:deazaflavin-dependent oxidoreductase (nitroreductase family)